MNIIPYDYAIAVLLYRQALMNPLFLAHCGNSTGE